MNLISITLISMWVLVYGVSSACVTPDNRNGDCISLTQCESLLALVNKPEKTNEDMMFLQKSNCGSPDGVAFDPKVCCPKQGESEPVYSINGPCNTPDGKPGKCVDIYSCPHISNMLKPPVSNEVLSFVQKSKCPSSVQYSVCCGPNPAAKPRATYTSAAVSCDAQMTAFPPDPSSQCCGEMASVGNKIVGVHGQATLIDEHPWTALIEYKRVEDETTTLLCGGSLISGKYVLTAAHCLTGKILKKARPQRVRLGEFDTTNEGMDCVPAAGGGEDCTDGAITFDIELRIPHPQYDQIKSKSHDIGLIRLKGTAPFTDFIRPVCLPAKDYTSPENTPPSFSMFAVGWGKTEYKDKSPVKVQVTLPYVSLEKCQPEFNKPGRILPLSRGQLCAGGSDGKDACNGDSGGPLVYENQTRFELIGVVSFGLTECGKDGVPGIYTNVYEYLDWIKSTIVA